MTPTIRVMTYNVHHCVGTDLRHSPERIAEIIREARPDLVALQELEVGRGRTGRIHQPATIAALLEMHIEFHPTVQRRGGAHGLAVLSPHSLLKIRSDNLPTVHGLEVESRGALWVAAEIGGREVHLINAHLGLTRGERTLQLKSLLGKEWFREPRCRPPRILCGDFNLTSVEIERLRPILREAETDLGVQRPPKTWPSFWPLRALDHILISGGIAVRGLEVPRNPLTRRASDHLPVIAECVLEGEPPAPPKDR